MVRRYRESRKLSKLGMHTPHTAPQTKYPPPIFGPDLCSACLPVCVIPFFLCECAGPFLSPSLYPYQQVPARPSFVPSSPALYVQSNPALWVARDPPYLRYASPLPTVRDRASTDPRERKSSFRRLPPISERESSEVRRKVWQRQTSLGKLRNN